MMKHCRKCGQEKDESEFYFLQSLDRLDSYCKECKKAYARQHYQKNRQRYLRLAAQWRSQHPDYFQQYNATHAAQKQDWRTMNKHCVARYNLLNGKITSIRFETAVADSTIVSQSLTGTKKVHMLYTFGSIKGTVQTLTRRRGLKFTIYDLIFDKAVTCYLNEGQEEIMRDAWGKRVIVSGRIGREPIKGYPVVMRDIQEIRVLKESAPGSYRRARGALATVGKKEASEQTIRRVRDA